MGTFKESQIFQFPFLSGQYPVSVVVNSYSDNGNIFVGLLSKDEEGYIELFGDVTVNISDLPAYHAALDTNNLSGIDEFVAKEGIGTFTGEYLTSGFCSYPVFEFSKDVLTTLHPEGIERYEAVLSGQTVQSEPNLAQEIQDRLGLDADGIDLIQM